jgi:RNA polymerase sigma-70 factor (ECF subfamily)
MMPLGHPLRVEPEPPPLDFDAIYDSEFGFVWNSLKRLGIHDHDLEDLTHDVFMRVYRSRAEYDPQRPIRPWLFGVAFRAASTFRRSARQRREVVADTQFHGEIRATEDPTDAAANRRLVLESLQALDLKKRAVFVMHELSGYSAPEIAEALGEPLNTVYSRLRVAREQFEAEVRRIRGEDDV